MGYFDVVAVEEGESRESIRARGEVDCGFIL